MRSIGVFCGSSVGNRPAFRAAAEELGRLLAQSRRRLVYGGGNIGLMGVIADEVLRCGGEVVGVIPRMLQDKELGHPGLTQLHVVESMHERKALMAQESDAFIALPGGFGTLEEIAEVITWTQLGVHAKPCGFLNVEGFYDPLLALFDTMVDGGLLSASNRSIVLLHAEPAGLLELLANWHAEVRPKWLGLSQT